MSTPAAWLLMMLLSFGKAPDIDHVKWRFSTIEQSGTEWKLVFTATIDRGWHLYSQNVGEYGPMPTEFEFNEEGDYKLVGKTVETGDAKKVYDSTFMMDVVWYEGQAVFVQRVKVRGRTKITGEINYSVCSEETCIPGRVRFNLDVGR